MRKDAEENLEGKNLEGEGGQQFYSILVSGFRVSTLHSAQTRGRAQLLRRV